MAKLLRRIVLLTLAAAAVAVLAWSFLPRPVDVETTEAVRGLLQVTIDEDGRTRIRERYVVSSPLAGRLQRIRLRPGAAVVQGETVLASIEPTDPELLDVRARAQAKARVRAAEAALARAEPQLETARIALEFALKELARVRSLEERNASTRQEVERAELEVNTQQQQYRSTQFATEIANFELEQARAALLRTDPQSNNGGEAGSPEPTPTKEGEEPRFDIRSPISGRVLRVFQESATVVTPGERLLELGDPTDLEIEVDALSTDAVRIRPGQAVIIEHWGGDVPLRGVVRLVEPSAFTKISALGVEEQRVNVILDLVDPPEQRPGLGDAFRVEGRIVVQEMADVLKVPTAALFREGDDWAVFVVQAGRARLQRMTIGARNDLEAEVLDRLAAGERVILHPGDRISDGVRVAER